MWTSGIGQTEVKCFDEYYRISTNLWRDSSPQLDERVVEAMGMVGEYKDLSILDLGGGVLLGRTLQHAKNYTVVDYSSIGCNLIKSLAPKIQVVNADALDYIKNCENRYDLVLALGLLEYCPPHGLEYLFRYCPSNALVFYTPVSEAYILHAPRTVIYTRNEIEETRKRYGWKLTKDLPEKEHVYTRYEKEIPE